jgi:Flp pilus assembly protein TadG
MLKLARTFAHARDGLAAVEFAFIAPVMIVMFFGAVEMSSAIDCNARVGRAAYTTADLVAQATSVSTSDVSNVFSAANAVLYPYTSTGAKIVVSSLVDDGKGGTKVAWSSAQNTTPRTVGSTVSVPSGLIVSGSGGSLILAEIDYSYSSAVAYFLKDGIALTDTFYARPRRSLKVDHT